MQQDDCWPFASFADRDFYSIRMNEARFLLHSQIHGTHHEAHSSNVRSAFASNFGPPICERDCRRGSHLQKAKSETLTTKPPDRSERPVLKGGLQTAARAAQLIRAEAQVNKVPAGGPGPTARTTAATDKG